MKAKKYMGRQHKGMERKYLWRMCKNCGEQTRIEVHNNQPVGRRRHKVMMKNPTNETLLSLMRPHGSSIHAPCRVQDQTPFFTLKSFKMILAEEFYISKLVGCWFYHEKGMETLGPISVSNGQHVLDFKR